MTVFTNDPKLPEILEVLRARHEVLLEVTVKQLYILHAGDNQSLERLVHDWFVKYRGHSHAYRDGSHIGGGDELIQVRNLTDGGREIVTERWERSTKYPGYEERLVDGHLHTRPTQEKV